MTDKFKIDSDKAKYHVQRVADWYAGKNVYPVYVEISPAGACNHRCSFCAADYIGYVQKYLDTDKLKATITNMAECGVKSIMFAGEGEPLLHTGLPDIIEHCAAVGIDVGITTNAVPLTERFCVSTLKHVKWIKASINGGSPETYAKVQGTNAKDWHRAWTNMQRAAFYRDEIRSKWGGNVHLGAQMVLLPENHHEAALFAQKAKDVGMDYCVVKPYSQHPMSKDTATKGYDKFKYSSVMDLDAELAKLNDDKFHVVFRRNTMRKLESEDRGYDKCYSTPHFWAYIMASGDVYGCSAYLLDERFKYGNIYSNTFREIWDGDKRKSCADYVAHQLDITECRKNCRMDEVNRYLWDLKHPPEHVNFI